ncbi:MAG: diguanylate cyclase domain-containing protein [Anaerotardibacter sp.]
MDTLSLYIGLSAIALLVDVVLFVVAIRKKDYKGKALACLLFAAVCVALFYLLSILAPDYLSMSFFSSFYFISVDFVAASLLVFCCIFMDTINKKWNKVFLVLACAYMIFDICLLLINPVMEISVTYAYSETAFTHWRYVPLFPFEVHLALCYCFVGMTLLNYFYKILTTPRVYRARYTIVIAGTIAVVAMNAIFLYLPEKGLPDFSVLFYSVVGVLFYGSTYRMGNRGMLTHTRQMIIEELGHPVVLFDYENLYSTSNKSADILLPREGVDQSYTLRKFLIRNDFDPDYETATLDSSFQWRVVQKGFVLSYRCDFRVLRDKKNNIIGRLFVFTDNALEVDLLTGFNTQASFEKKIWQNARSFSYPVAVGIVDINKLSELNSQFGREVGDSAIHSLVGVLRNHFSGAWAFVRLEDAELMVVCENMTSKHMHELLKEVEKDIAQFDYGTGPLSIQSAVSVVSLTERNVLKAVSDASSSLRDRKLLDPNSAHYSLLNSFVQTQRESDGETEAHVQRTRNMGECLGKRLGLTDKELSSLALLCLLHDIGKVGVPLEILNKPGKLNDIEWEIMKSHAEKGCRIAKASPELSDIADLILHHHEMWDGSGYPDGIKGELIPVPSRIIAIVDTYDAMVHDRPYRRAVSPKAAKEELRRCAGTQFDPYIVQEFLQMLEENPELDVAEKEEIEAAVPAEEIVVTPRSVDDSNTDFDRIDRVVPVHFAKFIIGDEDKIIDIDEGFTDLLGYEAEDLEKYNLSLLDIIPPDDQDSYKKITSERIATQGMAYLEHRVRRKDGSVFYVMCYGRQYFNSVHRCVEAEIVIADISESSILHRAIERQRLSYERSNTVFEEAVRRDKLVGVLNREAFRSDVQDRMLKNDSTVVMVMVDLDFFKEYNDRFGHPQGDALLIQVGKFLNKIVGHRGIVSRLGGDEYAIAFFFDKNANKEDVRKEIQVFYQIANEEMRDIDDNVTLSVGACIAEEGDDSFSSLYRNTDKALYEAKNSGRNNLKFGF